ncbi:phenylacetate--CoA ligase family protein [[Eubacterium] cellulosolvens]
MITRLLWNWLQLQRNQWLSKSELEELQLRKLKTILNHAYEKVPFYRKLYNKCGARPRDLGSLSDIQKFPVITKELVRDLPLKDRTAIDIQLSKCYERTSSGSTGIPITILEEESSLDYLHAYHLRRFLEYGYKPWHKILRLDTRLQRKRAKINQKTRKGLRKKFIDSRIKWYQIDENIERYLDIMAKEHFKLIIGPASYLTVIAKFAYESNNRKIKPRAIVSCGEILDETNRIFISKIFNSPVYDGYGCIEIAPLGMAWECRERSGLHINSDVVLLEILKDGEPVSLGEKGELIATSFFRFATPMIRYKIGDVVTLSDEKCSCGREMPLIKNIDGRLVDFLKMPNGKSISPYDIISAIQNIAGLAKYQVIQKNKNSIEIKIEKGKNFTQRTIMQLRDSCLELFGSEVQSKITVVESFPIIRGRKFRVVESQIR